MILAEIRISSRNGGIGVIMTITMASTAIGTPISRRPATRGGGAGCGVTGARALAMSEAPSSQLVDVGQDLGDGSIEIGWDFLAHFDHLVERLRQRRVLDDRDPGFRRGGAGLRGPTYFALFRPNPPPPP